MLKLIVFFGMLIFTGKLSWVTWHSPNITCGIVGVYALLMLLVWESEHHDEMKRKQNAESNRTD